MRAVIAIAETSSPRSAKSISVAMSRPLGSILPKPVLLVPLDLARPTARRRFNATRT
jgi:hypothetical protein